MARTTALLHRMGARANGVSARVRDPFWSASTRILGKKWLPQQESNLLERFRVGRLSADCFDRVALRQWWRPAEGSNLARPDLESSLLPERGPLAEGGVIESHSLGREPPVFQTGPITRSDHLPCGPCVAQPGAACRSLTGSPAPHTGSTKIRAFWYPCSDSNRECPRSKRGECASSSTRA